MLTVSGTLCRGEAAAVDVGIFLRTPEDVGEADEFVARGTATPNAQGAWTIQLTIPGSSAPGTYGVGAQCLVAGTQFFLYAPVDVMLSPPEAPPAVPVVRQPAFTG